MCIFGHYINEYPCFDIHVGIFLYSRCKNPIWFQMYQIKDKNGRCKNPPCSILSVCVLAMIWYKDLVPDDPPPLYEYFYVWLHLTDQLSSASFSIPSDYININMWTNCRLSYTNLNIMWIHQENHKQHKDFKEGYLLSECFFQPPKIFLIAYAYAADLIGYNCIHSSLLWLKKIRKRNWLKRKVKPCDGWEQIKRKVDPQVVDISNSGNH